MVFFIRFVQSPIWFSEPPYRKNRSFLAAPYPAARDQKTFCTCSSLIQSAWFSHKGRSRPLEADGRQTAIKVKQNVAGSNQISGYSRPLTGSRRHFNQPNNKFMLKSFPFITCQTALASLQAKAFRATIALLRCFLRSYQA